MSGVKSGGRIRVPDVSGYVDLLTGRPLAEAAGKKRLLLHFMSGGCVNCLHLLAELAHTAMPEDMAVVSVHTGKFPKEGEEAYIRRLIDRVGIDHPVICDRGGRLRDAFALKAWPTLVLVEKGYEVARATGEGQVAKIVGSDALAVAKRVRRPSTGFDKIAYDGRRLWLSDPARGQVLCVRLDGEICDIYDGFEEPRGVATMDDLCCVADRKAGKLWLVKEGDRKVLAEGLRSPWGVTTNGRGFQVAEAGGHRILQIDPQGRMQLLAGLGFEGVQEGDALNEALFAQPTDLDWLDGVLYVLDAEGSAIRAIEKGRVETPVGWDLFTYGDRDGIGEEVRLQHPEGLCAGVGGCGNQRIFIADTYNDKVKVFDPLTARVMTLVSKTTMPTGLVKVGCDLWIVDGVADTLLKFDISTMQSERIEIR